MLLPAIIFVLNQVVTLPSTMTKIAFSATTVNNGAILDVLALQEAISMYCPVLIKASNGSAFSVKSPKNKRDEKDDKLDYLIRKLEAMEKKIERLEVGNTLTGELLDEKIDVAIEEKL